MNHDIFLRRHAFDRSAPSSHAGARLSPPNIAFCDATFLLAGVSR
jgi:hypothetical protein